jgi:hypothetical protein
MGYWTEGAIVPATETQTVASANLTTATTAYTAGDTLGDGYTFTLMAKQSGKGGRITGVKMLDKADIVSSIDLYLSSGSITFGTDNVAPSVSDSDAAKIISIIPLVYNDLGTSRLLSSGNILVPYICDATSLYVYAVTRVGHTFFGATTDLPLTLFYDRD